MPKQVVSIFVSISLFFILLFTYTKLAGPIPFYINSTTTTKSTSFDVSGTGKVSVVPDIAIVRVGVISTGQSAKQAQDQLNINVNKVSESIKKLGIDKKDIKTENYNVNPNYDFKDGSQRINSYSGNTNLSFKVRKLDLVDQIIDVATTQGANQVGGVSFEVEDKLKAENEARKLAIEQAKKKADYAASLAGFKLGKIINYQENPIDFPRPIQLDAERMPVQGSDEVPTNIEPGSSEIQISITLSYEVL